MRPKDPIRAGYTFNSWTVGESGEQWNFDNAVKSNLILHASWTANENTIIFDGNGANGGSMNDQKIHTDVTAKLEQNAFSKVGYVFAGWSTTADGTVEYFDGSDYLMGSDPEVTLYAVWTANENIIIFDGNGANGGSMNDQKIHTDVTAKLEQNAFTKAGYVFAGWSTTADGTVEYFDGSDYLMGSDPEVTLYAVWVIDTHILYTVEHYKQSLEDEENYQFVESEQLHGVGGTLTKAQAESYDGFAAMDFDQQTISLDGSTVIRINYLRNSYDITFTFEEANFSKAKTVKYGENIALNEFNITGYIVTEWQTQDGEPFAGGAFNFTQNIDFIATKWNYKEITTVDELEEFANARLPRLVIADNLTLDRTIYLNGNVTIASNKDVVLTRSPNFTGDIFVIGQDADGWNSALFGEETVVSLNEAESKFSITIDGNKTNASGVKGTAIFMANGATLRMYNGINIVNHFKTSNELTADPQQIFDYPDRIGGAAIINNCGLVEIYGGKIANNEVLTEDNEELCAQGGAIYNLGTIKMYGGELSDNKAYKGGSIYNVRSIWLEGGEVKSSTATYGGGIYQADSVYSNLFLDGVKISRNNAISSGGAIYQGVSCGVLIEGDTVISENSAVNNGGAICSYGSIVMHNGKFNGNFAGSKGGAIYQRHNFNAGVQTIRHLEVHNGNFVNNVANTGGGAIAMDDSGKAYINGGTFKENKAIEGDKGTLAGGGAFYIIGSAKVEIKDAVIDANHSDKAGGAVYIKSGGKLNIISGTIINNVAMSGGGGIYVKEANSELNICSAMLKSNAAKTHGGAIYAYTDSKINIAGAAIENNDALENGGGIYFNATAAANIGNDNSSVTISGNNAESGGGIYATSNCELVITNAAISNNLAAKNGGAIAIASNAKLNAANLLIESNSALSGGGGIYTADSGAELLLSDVVLRSNTSVSHGGAVYLYTDAKAEFNNTIIESNSVKGTKSVYGGAIYANGAILTMRNCSLLSNTTSGNYGGGIYATSSAIIDMYNAIFRGNDSIGDGKYVYAGGGANAGAVITFHNNLVSDYAIDNELYFKSNSNGQIVNNLAEVSA